MHHVTDEVIAEQYKMIVFADEHNIQSETSVTLL